MDKSRQQFEAFISKGDYPWVKGIIPVMWMVWQASRESYLLESQEITCDIDYNKKLCEILEARINQQRS